MGPGKSLFDAISKELGKINIIAEDLVSLADLIEKEFYFYWFFPFSYLCSITDYDSSKTSLTITFSKFGDCWVHSNYLYLHDRGL